MAVKLMKMAKHKENKSRKWKKTSRTVRIYQEMAGYDREDIFHLCRFQFFFCTNSFCGYVLWGSASPPPKMTKNDQKWPKMTQNDPKHVQKPSGIIFENIDFWRFFDLLWPISVIFRVRSVFRGGGWNAKTDENWLKTTKSVKKNTQLAPTAQNNWSKQSHVIAEKRDFQPFFKHFAKNNLSQKPLPLAVGTEKRSPELFFAQMWNKLDVLVGNTLDNNFAIHLTTQFGRDVEKNAKSVIFAFMTHFSHFWLRSVLRGLQKWQKMTKNDKPAKKPPKKVLNLPVWPTKMGLNPHRSG